MSQKIDPRLLFEFKIASLELRATRHELLAFLEKGRRLTESHMDSYLANLITLAEDALGGQNEYEKRGRDIENMPPYLAFEKVSARLANSFSEKIEKIKKDKSPTPIRKESDIVTRGTKSATQNNLKKTIRLAKRYTKARQTAHRQFIQSDMRLKDISRALPIAYDEYIAKRTRYYGSKQYCSGEEEQKTLLFSTFPRLQRYALKPGR